MIECLPRVTELGRQHVLLEVLEGQDAGLGWWLHAQFKMTAEEQNKQAGVQ